MEHAYEKSKYHFLHKKKQHFKKYQQKNSLTFVHFSVKEFSFYIIIMGISFSIQKGEDFVGQRDDILCTMLQKILA